MTPGRYVLHLRQRRGWDREQLALGSGVPLGTIEDFEEGRRSRLASEQVVNIAHALRDQNGVLARLYLGEAIQLCETCGCHDRDACWDDEHGACWWVTEQRCSHCTTKHVGGIR